MANYQGVPLELHELSYNHIGDIDVYNNVIYGGIEADHGNGVIAAWNASDLSFMRYRITEQSDMPWVAVDSLHKKIYSAKWNDCCQLYVYDLTSFELLGLFPIAEGQRLPPEIQGGAFYKGDLYVATNQNDEVWKINVKTGDISLELSDEYDRHEYEVCLFFIAFVVHE